MNFTQDELKEIQAIHNVQDSELGTRMPSEQEFQAFNATIQELWEKGFVVSKSNFLKLWLAFDASPQVPITRNTILDSTKRYRDEYAWKTAEEMEFRKLSAQIGPEQAALVTRELGRHGLINTAGTQELYSNFAAVVHYYQSQGWPITAGSFEKAIGNLRTSLGHGVLHYKLTPNQQAAAKRWDKAREAYPPPTIQGLLEAAKQRAASVAHIVTPDGERLSDKMMRDFFERHPEAMETAEAPAKKTPPAITPDEAYWKKQTEDYIRSLSGQNLQQEAQQSFGQPLHGSWRQTHSSLQIWHERKKLGVWGQR